MNDPTLAVKTLTVMALKEFSNNELAAFNNAVQTWGTVAKQNLSYTKAVDFNIIREDGKPFDLEAVRDASAFEVNRRFDAGIFN